MEKLQKVFQDKDLQKDSIQEYEKWLTNSKQKLKEFENMKTIYSDTKINDFKLIMADKENASVLLEKAIEAGENMFSERAPNDRDRMTPGIRSLRDGWGNHIDNMDVLNKSIEASGYPQQAWSIRTNLKEKYGEVKDQSMRSNVEAKEAQLKTYKSLKKTIKHKGKES